MELFTTTTHFLTFIWLIFKKKNTNSVIGWMLSTGRARKNLKYLGRNSCWHPLLIMQHGRPSSKSWTWSLKDTQMQVQIYEKRSRGREILQLHLVSNTRTSTHTNHFLLRGVQNMFVCVCVLLLWCIKNKAKDKVNKELQVELVNKSDLTLKDNSWLITKVKDQSNAWKYGKKTHHSNKKTNKNKTESDVEGFLFDYNNNNNKRCALWHETQITEWQTCSP